jgi:hypothetical protein
VENRIKGKYGTHIDRDTEKNFTEFTVRAFWNPTTTKYPKPKGIHQLNGVRISGRFSITEYRSR